MARRIQALYDGDTAPPGSKYLSTVVQTEEQAYDSSGQPGHKPCFHVKHYFLVPNKDEEIRN